MNVQRRVFVMLVPFGNFRRNAALVPLSTSALSVELLNTSNRVAIVVNNFNDECSRSQRVVLRREGELLGLGPKRIRLEASLCDATQIMDQAERAMWRASR